MMMEQWMISMASKYVMPNIINKQKTLIIYT